MAHVTRTWRRLAGALAMGLLLAAAGSGRADVVIFNTSDPPIFNPNPFTDNKNQGWWSPDTFNGDINANYFVGRDENGRNHHDFFTFHLGRLDLKGGQIVSATLRLTLFQPNGEPTLRFGFWDVATPANVLNHKANNPNQQIYDDLGSGVNYGNFLVSTTVAENTVLAFPLNAAALADLTAAAGRGDFSIGGALDLTGLTGPQYLFGVSQSGGVQQLVLVTGPATAVPEPGTLGLFGLGALGLLGYAWGRRRGLR